MLFSCGHVLQKMTSQGKSGWPILWMWRNLLPQATLSFLNKIMNAIDYSISQQQKPTMSLQKGTIISRLAQLFGGRLIKLDHPHHRGSNVFFSYFNFFAFEFSLQNAMLLSKLSSTLNIMISHTTFFTFLLWNTHTSQTKKKSVHGSCSVFYYLGNRWPDRMVDWPLTTQIQYQLGDSILQGWNKVLKKSLYTPNLNTIQWIPGGRNHRSKNCKTWKFQHSFYP